MKRKGHARGLVVGTLIEVPPLDRKSSGPWPFCREEFTTFWFQGPITRGVNCELINFALVDDECEYRFTGTLNEYDPELTAWKCTVNQPVTFSLIEAPQ